MKVTVKLSNGAKVNITEGEGIGVTMQVTNPQRYKSFGRCKYNCVVSGVGVLRILQIWEGVEKKNE